MPDDDVDRPAAELNALAPTGPSPTGKLARIVGWLERLVEMRGSDVLLVAGLPPSIIRDGAVTHDPMDAVIAGADVEDAVLPALCHLRGVARAAREGWLGWIVTMRCSAMHPEELEGLLRSG